LKKTKVFDNLNRDRDTLRTRIAVIGSGPGGAITAALLAEAGREVVLVEEGQHLPLESCEPFSRQEMVQKYRNGGLTLTMGSAKVNYVEARCVGGGSEINSALYHRTPPDCLAMWREQFKIAAFDEVDLEPHFVACEKDLNVSYLPGEAPAASLRLHEGALQLGWKSSEVPRWFQYDDPGPTASGSGTRQSMTRTFIPRFLKAGGRLVPETRIHRLRPARNGWFLEGQDSEPTGGAKVPRRIEADVVFVACGAIQTPNLLRRSGVRQNVGGSLYLHPTVKVLARFDEEVNDRGMGVPVHQVKQFAPRFSLGCSISTPPYLALALGNRPDAAALIAKYGRQMAIYYAMTTGGQGTVRHLPGFRDPLVRYQLDHAAGRDLAEALRALCECLFAGGAKALYPAIEGGGCLTSASELHQLPGSLTPEQANLMTIHLFGSCPMGENRSRCAADSFGKVHGPHNLYIADASLMCGPPGVNPQGTVMAIARRNALNFLNNA
jgi:choline dehydrogenase-like flavoprotein